MTARTCAVGTEKGGEGKTLTVFHLASMVKICLQCKVLVVGFDPQMHVELLMGWSKAQLNRKRSIFDCVRSIPEDLIEEEDKTRITDVIMPTYLDSTYTYISQHPDVLAQQHPEDQIIQGPDLAFINSKAMSTTDVTSKPGWATFLQEALQPVIDQYDYVFIDTNPTGGPHLAMALAASDFVLIPLKPEELDAEGFKGIRLMIRAAQKPNINPKLRIAGVFFNQVQPSWKLHKDYQQQVRNALLAEGIDCPCFETTVRHLVAIADGVSTHSPITLRDPYCPASKSLWQLLQELMISLGGPGVPRLYKYVQALDEEGQQLFERSLQHSEKAEEETANQDGKKTRKKEYAPFLLPRFEQHCRQAVTKGGM